MEIHLVELLKDRVDTHLQQVINQHINLDQYKDKELDNQHINLELELEVDIVQHHTDQEHTLDKLDNLDNLDNQDNQDNQDNLEVVIHKVEITKVVDKVEIKVTMDVVLETND